MTKRITALLLALLMVIGTVPTPAFAADGSNATEETTQTVCGVCNLIGCTVTHIQCEKCGNYDCTADHTNWCDTCKVDNCGVDHSAAEPSEAADSPCVTCGTVSCTADHTNWCDTCKKDNCGTDHSTDADTTFCATCGKETCTCEPDFEPDTGSSEEKCNCGQEVHTATCPLYVTPECNCEAAEGVAHAETCPLYVAPVCTCEAAEGQVHAETCPLYEELVCTCEATEDEPHTRDCPLYEERFTDIADEPARAAVLVFAESMENQPIAEMIAYFKAEQVLNGAWGSIPLDSPEVPVEEQAAFDAAKATLIAALETDAENLETVLNEILVGIVYAYYDADELLADGVDAYFGADSQIITDYKTLEPHADLGIETYATPKSPAPVGIVTNDITVNLFNYGSNVNSVGSWKFNMNGGNELDSGTQSGGQENPKIGSTLVDGYPVIEGFYDANGTYSDVADISLAPYYTPSNPTDTYTTDTNYGVKYYPVDTVRLFQYSSDTGTYTYNSALNHAYYDSSNNSLTAYDYALRSFAASGYFSGQGEFLPFNAVGNNYANAFQLTDSTGANAYKENEYEFWNSLPVLPEGMTGVVREGSESIAAGQTFHPEVTVVAPHLYALRGGTNNRSDMAFGMTVEFDFYMPQGGRVNGQDMIFKFRGDDDVLVFIDDKLVLNIGGNRGVTEGSINFVSGKVFVSQQYSLAREDTSLASTALGRNTTLAACGIDTSAFSKHTLKFFYAERWGGASNCYMQFNMPVLIQGNPTVTKIVENLNGAVDTDEVYTFQMKDTNGNAVAGGKYTVGDTVFTTDSQGKFTLKNGQTAQFSALALGDRIIVEEIIDENAKYTTDVTVDGTQQEQDTITDAIEITRQTSEIVFTNTRTDTQDITISKDVKDSSGNDLNAGDADYSMTLTVGDKLYTGKATKNNQEIDITDGTFTLKDGESITVFDIPVGYTYKVSEAEPDSAPYGYAVSNPQFNGGPGTFNTAKEFTVGTTNQVTVTNIFIPSYGDLKIRKTVTGTSSTAEKFTFTVKFSDNTTQTVTLEAGQETILEKVPIGTFTVTETDLPAHFYPSDPARGEVSGEITVGATAEAAFVNTYEPAKLTVTKSYDIDPNQEFQFRVTFAGQAPVEFTLKHGETKVFDPAPLGQYTVEEYNLPLGIYQQSAVNASGTLTRGDSITATFTNEYKPANLTVTKTVNGSDTTRKFKIQVTFGNGSIQTVELANGEPHTFENIPLGEYKVEELDIPLGFYETIEGATDTAEAGETKTATVTNEYAPAGLTIKKTVDVVEEGTNTPEVTDFQFTITVPSGVTGTYEYTVGNDTKTATVTDGAMTITLRNGQTATFTNLPVGEYTVTEAAYEDKGYNDLYSVNKAEAVDSDSATVTLARGTTQTVECLNKFPVGDLIIEKTVTKEFYGTDWNGDNFTFTVERTTAGRPLVENNRYKVLLDGVEQDATIAVDDDGKLTVRITFDGTDAAKLDEETEANDSASHTLTIKNLPAGTYKVTEAANTAYTQNPTDLTVSGLTIPAETTKAEFVNQLKRPAGSLSLTKILEAATGFNPDELPKGTKFSFTIELTEQPPTDSQTFGVAYVPKKYTDGTDTPTSETMEDGTFTVELEAGQKVTINGLPIGKYRITEATIPQYANNFAHIVNGVEKVQTPKVTSDGCLYTEIDVPANGTAEIKCTNTYPVDRAELVIQKLVKKAYGRDALPSNLTFMFDVTLAEEDSESYTYKIYDANGNVVKDGDNEERTAPVSAKKFSIQLAADQYAVIQGMPVCGYTVSEKVNTTDYNASYKVYVSKTGEEASTQVNTTGTVNAFGTERSVSGTFSAGNTDTIVFTNEYKQHLGTLTITKTVVGGSAGDIFVFHIKGADTDNAYIDMDVTITGSGSVKIFDLPLGTYTVTEDTDWSWRYNQTDSDTTDNTITLDDLHANVTFTNEQDEQDTDKWLNYTANMSNVFGKNASEQEGS